MNPINLENGETHRKANQPSVLKSIPVNMALPKNSCLTGQPRFLSIKKAGGLFETTTHRLPHY